VTHKKLVLIYIRSKESMTNQVLYEQKTQVLNSQNGSSPYMTPADPLIPMLI